mmetsp:Transcript_10792/g.19686  ORF Transcript_10792/g.19686 Transcript_10792/m.19686 type:complete len:226 (-) Transcript_10792:777-1454(-)
MNCHDLLEKLAYKLRSLLVDCRSGVVILRDSFAGTLSTVFEVSTVFRQTAVILVEVGASAVFVGNGLRLPVLKKHVVRSSDFNRLICHSANPLKHGLICEMGEVHDLAPLLGLLGCVRVGKGAFRHPHEDNLSIRALLLNLLKQLVVLSLLLATHLVEQDTCGGGVLMPKSFKEGKDIYALPIDFPAKVAAENRHRQHLWSAFEESRDSYGTTAHHLNDDSLCLG